jgi:LmbE family N-acetylglucosaminyl deacetylase
MARSRVGSITSALDPLPGVLRLTFGDGNQRLRRVLCLGAHCDDIEIGCGGTVLRLIAEHPDAEFLWVVFASDETRAREAASSAELFLKGAKSKRIVFHTFRDGFFPYDGAAVKEVFLELEKDFAPDVVFTHFRHDLHQDHRVISELTWNSFRNHLILEYEIPKYDGDLGAPNCFVPLTPEICNRKIEFVLTSFQSQRSKYWFNEATFLSLLRLRGMEIRSTTQYAEAFYCRKMQL